MKQGKAKPQEPGNVGFCTVVMEMAKSRGNLLLERTTLLTSFLEWWSGVSAHRPPLGEQ